MKHSSEPNLGAKVVAAEGDEHRRPETVLLIWALRAIDEGEELTVDLTQGRSGALAAAAWAEKGAREMWADDDAWAECRKWVDTACHHVAPEASAATAKQVFLSWVASQGGGEKEGDGGEDGNKEAGGAGEKAGGAGKKEADAGEKESEADPMEMVFAMAMARSHGPSLKSPSSFKSLVVDLAPSSSGPPARLSVFTDLPLLQRHATSPRFEFVSSEAEAEVIFCGEHMSDFRALSLRPGLKGVNQIPFESCLTTKALLPETVRKGLGCGEEPPPWLPITFALPAQLASFLRRHLLEEERDWTWICKPSMGSRSRNILVTRSRIAVARYAEMGPAVACRYVERPLLLQCRKVDIRFYVALALTAPPKAMVYKRFYTRVAAADYDPTQMGDLDRHVTVQCYRHGKGPTGTSGIDAALDERGMLRMEDFVTAFEAEHGERWQPVEDGIHRVLGTLLSLAAEKCGAWPRCHALYGVDVMLTREAGSSSTGGLQPVVLEVNYSPDPTTVLAHDPSFYDNVLAGMFGGVPPEECNFATLQLGPF